MDTAVHRCQVVLDNALWRTIESHQKKVMWLEITALPEPLWREMTTRAVQKRIVYLLLPTVTMEIPTIPSTPYTPISLCTIDVH
jgi:hypothetical protein